MVCLEKRICWRSKSEVDKLMKYRTLLRCRLCGEEYTLEPKELTQDKLEEICNAVDGEKQMLVSIDAFHNCGDGSIGTSYIIGIIPDQEQGEKEEAMEVEQNCANCENKRLEICNHCTVTVINGKKKKPTMFYPKLSASYAEMPLYLCIRKLAAEKKEIPLSLILRYNKSL